MAAAYGSWRSPITTKLITAGSLRLGSLRVEGGRIIWNESRPLEGGRGVLVSGNPKDPKDIKDVINSDFNARTLVHEYGGGEFHAHSNLLFFSNMKDQRIYYQDLGSDTSSIPKALTEAGSKLRFADYVFDTKRNRLIAVVEDHTNKHPSKVRNFIGAISIAGEGKDGKFQSVKTLVEGSDFYSSPRLSGDGSRLAYISWNHPNMPWDETKLEVSTLLEDGEVQESRIVAGDSEPQSLMSPLFSPIDGKLYFITDTTGWWSICREEKSGSGSQHVVVPVASKEGAEFAGPPWTMGHQPYTFLPNGEILCTFGGPGIEGGDQLGLIDTTTNKMTIVPTPPFAALGDVSCGLAKDGNQIIIGIVCGSPTEPTSVKSIVVESSSDLIHTNPSTDWNILRKASELNIDHGYLSKPEKIEFPTENGQTSHMYFYPPKNVHEQSIDGELPPLLVKSHGGPTSSTSSSFSLGIQFWTSRGIAVADVNYGGSTGYGKEYRQRLTKPPSWGIVDVDDCTNAAKYLASAGKVDSKRMAISGGSAGGYTTLACLAFRDVFAAGASHYGIGNLEALASETHKFESRYLDNLVGKYPDDKLVYLERSPINHVDDFSCPLIQFQGLEDKVVPPNQALEVFDALIKKGVPTSCVLFEGEQHGFRRAKNIRRALDTELEFYGSVFGFHPMMPNDHVSFVMGEKVTVGIEEEKEEKEEVKKANNNKL
jgi:dienelactone hydrolase